MALTEPTALTFDAGNLDQSSDRVAGQSEIVLDADLGRVLHLFRGAAEQFRQTTGRHCAGRPDLTLATHLSAGDGSILLEQQADRRCHQQEPDHAVRAVGADEIPVIVQDGRHDAGGAIGWCGDHPPAGGVLLVDGQRVQGHPFHRPQGVGLVGLGGQSGAQRGRTATYLQPTRQHARGCDAFGRRIPA